MPNDYLLDLIICNQENLQVVLNKSVKASVKEGMGTFTISITMRYRGPDPLWVGPQLVECDVLNFCDWDSTTDSNGSCQS